jgi:hydroxymethylpyrimidine/phosphomethylpyrimidine kinase
MPDNGREFVWRPRIKTVLTIAGFDPSSGAGITADLATIAAHGMFGTSAITALTVQSTLGVKAVHPIASEVLAETLETLVADIAPDGIKIGMLATEENVRAVAKFLIPFQREYGGTKIPVVLDPVLRSSSGAELLSAAGVEAMRRELLHLVTWITPNLDELAILAETTVETEEQMEREAIWMADEWCDLGVVATGGHLTAANDFWVEPGGKAGGWLLAEKIESRATHGTGCAFSTALVCALVDDEWGERAVERAKKYVEEGIRRAQPIGGGPSPLGLLWPLRKHAGS